MRHKHILNTGLTVVLALGLTACAGELAGPDLGDDSEEVGSTRQDIDNARIAIFEGLDIGRVNIVTTVNQVLSDNLLSAEFMQGVALPDPLPPEEGACPFLESGSGDVSLNCRFIVERARDLAYTRVANPLDDGPLSPELADLEEDKRLYVERWFQEGTFSGVDGEVVRAVAELRRVGACDTAPTPAENSEMAGFEVGRDLFLGIITERIANTPATVCDFDAGIVRPAIAEAEAAMDRTVTENPLCGGFTPTEAATIMEFDRAKLSYELGLRQGIQDQAVLSSQDLLDNWVCTPPPPPGGGGGGGGGGGSGDPLVLDLDGDGVDPLSLGSKVGFDLTGTGLVEMVAWPSGDDALLAIDLDNSGAIENGRELFSNYMVGPGSSRFATGFEALAVYDRAAMGGNDDGVIDAGDAVYAKLLVWSDLNDNGTSESNELTGLAAAGITSLPFAAEALGNVRNGDGVMTETAGILTEVWMDLRF